MLHILLILVVFFSYETLLYIYNIIEYVTDIFLKTVMYYIFCKMSRKYKIQFQI